MTSCRLPTEADFAFPVAIVPPPPDHQPTNVLVLLHGIGDTNVPFTNLARSLQLPATCCLSLQGPQPLPGLFTGSDAPAFHWADDVLFDELRGELDLDAGFTASSRLWDRVQHSLTQCGYRPRQIFFFGFGQGGMAALNIAASEVEFGGVVSVGGPLPSSAPTSKVRTPVLVLGGSRSTQVTRPAVARMKEVFADVQYVKWTKEDDSMPRNRDEMLPIMKFLARRLLAPAPDGTIEV